MLQEGDPVPWQLLQTTIVHSDASIPIPQAGFSATVEPEADKVVLSGIYANASTDHENEELGIKFKGVTALLSTLDEAIALAIAKRYRVPVLRKAKTSVPQIKTLFENRGFALVKEVKEEAHFQKSYGGDEGV